jgi:hypothetical protein
VRFDYSGTYMMLESDDYYQANYFRDYEAYEDVAGLQIKK